MCRRKQSQDRRRAADSGEAAYTGWFTGVTRPLGEALSEFSDLNGQLGDNPAALEDESWILRTGANTVVIEQQAQAFLDYDAATVPPRFVEMHGKYREGMEPLRDSMELYRQGIDNRDSGTLQEALELFREAEALIVEASGMIE